MPRSKQAEVTENVVIAHVDVIDEALILGIAGNRSEPIIDAVLKRLLVFLV